MANDKEIAVILSLKDQLSKEMDKVKQNVSAGAKIMGTALTAMSVAGVAAILALAKSAGEQEIAEVKLSQAMKQVGKYSDEAFNHLKDYATALQASTTFGDEAIMSVEEMLMRFGAEGPLLDKLTKATLDLAAAKGMDLAAAADLVSKSIGSSTNALTRYGITVEGDVGSTERLQMAVDNITKLFGGAAQAQAETYLGRIQQISNRFGDLKEKIGMALLPTMNKLLDIGNKAIEWLENLSPKTVDLIAKILLWGTAIAGVLGPMLLFIGYLPSIVAGMVNVAAAIKAAILVLSGPVGLVIALGLAVAEWARYIEMTAKAKNQSDIAIKTKAGMVAEMKHENDMLIRQRSSLGLHSGAYDRLTEKIEQQEKAIVMLEKEARKEARTTEASTDTKKELVAVLSDVEWQTDRLMMSFEDMQAAIKAEEDAIKKAAEEHKKFNETVEDWVKKKGAESIRMSEANAAAFITMAQRMFESGVTLENTFSTVVDGVSRMFDPVTGAAIQMGGSIIKKLFWGKKEAPEVIDENLKIISDYIDSIRFKWGQFAVDIAKAMSDALQLPTIEEGLSNIFSRVKAKFQTEFANLISGQLMQTPEYQERMRNIGNIMSLLSSGVSYTPGGVGMGGQPIAPTGTRLVNPYTGQVEFVQSMERLREIFLAGEMAGLSNYLTQSVGGLKSAYDQLASFLSAFDIPQMAAGGIIKASPGGTLVNVGEGGEDEYIVPKSKMKGGNVLNVYFSGVFAADRSSMAKLAREYLIPEINRFKLKTGEAF